MKSTSLPSTAPSRSTRLAVLLAACAVLTIADVGRTEGTGESGGGALTVRFSGIEEAGGVVIFSVASSQEMFESEDEAQLILRVPADGAKARAVYENLAPGEYAVKVFHDANENEKIDMGMMGPKEKFGFSNNAMGFLGPPDFDDAKFEFDGRELTIDIEAH